MNKKFIQFSTENCPKSGHKVGTVGTMGTTGVKQGSKPVHKIHLHLGTKWALFGNKNAIFGNKLKNIFSAFQGDKCAKKIKEVLAQQTPLLKVERGAWKE